MHIHIATTPFGRRPMTLGQISSQMKARAIPAGTTVNKWQVLQFIRDARTDLGASDRALAILNALLSFHPDTMLTEESDLVVFPSNERLISRANGMSQTTLRRHLAVLVECGLIIRRDSPNGKRFARKGQGGEIEQAFGFDLSPILARAAEFQSIANTVSARAAAMRAVKERLTICRRDITKTIAVAIEEGVPGDWATTASQYAEVVRKLPRSATFDQIERVADELGMLLREVRNDLESLINSQIMVGNESRNDRHIQNSNPKSSAESENGPGTQKEKDCVALKTERVRPLLSHELPLGIVMDACPDLCWASRDQGDIRTWRDFMAAADSARPALGISPSAWADAQAAMGQQVAAVTVAAIYQRQDRIANPGGYLRSLASKASSGKFSVLPMVMALLRSRKEDVGNGSRRDRTVQSRRSGTDELLVDTSVQLEISDALRRTIERRNRR